ncbi:FAD-binding oxidoreductase [Donghicola mangrovi]|uniref:D-lactate dehydrogenase (cytochrome) n=1 Tax=Donghicola mangrovi TaxID=2729614 RepID=A0A850Q1L9_9RHOB|nr:FAD-linked oxidase C-terminal domain-containing protein [Donghicola mangrovi]NVO23497.1 FAD-binding protein [Donghicola mangrovi]
MTKSDALHELSTLLGQRLSTSKFELEAHGRSESYFPLTLPDGVAFPTSTEEVSEIVRICARHGLPVIGWGAGTSLEGHALAHQGGVVVDFRNMAAILDVHAEDMTVTVQPGITREALNEELRATGLFFPVDPGANATLGGMASTRASGTTAVRYGTMRDNVMALEVVLADGRVIRTGSHARKSAAGFDLTALMIGAEGTLGLITELTLKLQGQPESVGAAVCAFDSISDAVETVIETIQFGLPMARIEFIDADTAAAVNAYSGSKLPECPHLLVEFHGSETALAEQAEVFGGILAEHGGKGFDWATAPEDRKALWHARHHAYWAILNSRPGCRAVVTDMCVPISRLAQAVEATRADIAASGIKGPILGHVGDGNFHAILMIDDDNPAELQIAKDLADRMARRALSYGGTVTGEHGVGYGKLDYMALEHGGGWDVMASIKQALDPQNIMNPGKVVRVAG